MSCHGLERQTEAKQQPSGVPPVQVTALQHQLWWQFFLASPSVHFLPNYETYSYCSIHSAKIDKLVPVMTKEEAQTYGLIWPLTFLLSFATFDIHFLTFFLSRQWSLWKQLSAECCHWNYTPWHVSNGPHLSHRSWHFRNNLNLNIQQDYKQKHQHNELPHCLSYHD
jgi:hypothetical protein